MTRYQGAEADAILGNPWMVHMQYNGQCSAADAPQKCSLNLKPNHSRMHYKDCPSDYWIELDGFIPDNQSKEDGVDEDMI